MISSEKRYRNISVFDVDGTLIESNIGVTFVKYLLRIGEVGILPKLMIVVCYSLYKISILDFKYAILMGAWALNGKSTDNIAHHAEICFEREIREKIFQQGIVEISRKKRDGDYVILATGAHSTIASIFGKHVGADFVVATTSYIVKEKYTLRVNRPLPYKRGKSDLVFQHIEKIFRQPKVTVYTDEKKDIPMLERADVLVGVNADDTVRKYVKEKGGSLVSFT